jgi:hypothetical protein
MAINGTEAPRDSRKTKELRHLKNQDAKKMKIKFCSLREQSRQKFRCHFFPRLFLFYRVFGCFSAMGVQKHYKKRFAKKLVSKSFNKKFDQKSKTDFSRFVLITFLGVSR